MSHTYTHICKNLNLLVEVLSLKVRILNLLALILGMKSLAKTLVIRGLYMCSYNNHYRLFSCILTVILSFILLDIFQIFRRLWASL